MNNHHFAVILAGGKGERFWPLSTARRPKQLLALVGERSLVAQAVDRLGGLIPPERIFIVTNRELIAACREAVPELPPDQIIGEPVGRDTAAAVALGAGLVKSRDPKGVFCVLTADHVIGPIEAFQRVLRTAMDRAAAHDVLLTIGIPPTEPSTGFGYIDSGDTVGEADGVNFHRVKRFVEKPDRATAEKYLASGTFFWNSGMFIWSVASIESAFRAHRADLADLIDSVATAKPGELDAVLAREFEKRQKISIDYALMEKAKNIEMAKAVFSWDDVGSWTALENHFAADKEANTAIGDVVSHSSSHNIVFSKNHLTTLVGVKDLIVVQSDGVTLVCHRDHAQDIKKLLEKLRADQRHAGLV